MCNLCDMLGINEIPAELQDVIHEQVNDAFRDSLLEDIKEAMYHAEDLEVAHEMLHLFIDAALNHCSPAQSVKILLLQAVLCYPELSENPESAALLDRMLEAHGQDSSAEARAHVLAARQAEGLAV